MSKRTLERQLGSLNSNYIDNYYGINGFDCPVPFRSRPATCPHEIQVPDPNIIRLLVKFDVIINIEAF